MDVTDTPERRAERALARFQAVSKAEETVARAYLSLHDPSNAPGEGFQRTLPSTGTTLWSFDDEKKRGEGEGPEAALEHYFDDEAWEAGGSRPVRGKDGRWTVVGAVLPEGVEKAR